MANFRAGLAALAALVATASGAETITSHGISAFGELKYPPSFAHFDYVNPDAPRGGTMSFRGQGASRTFDSLNPFILRGEPAQGYELLYDTLLARAYDEPDAAYGLLAEAIEYPPDRSWVIFTLRDDARFADGTPVEAHDVKFTIEILQTEGSPLWSLQLKDVASVEVLDPRRVRIDFTEGVSMRDQIANVGSFHILPEHFYDEIDFTRSSLIEPLGSGPYTVFKTDPGRSITYCQNEEYWGADLPVNVGHDNFECVRYEYFADTTAAFEAFKAGGYLFHEEFSSSLWATNYDFPALNEGSILRRVIPDGRPSGAQGFYLNLRRDKFADPRVRQALGMMFNFEWSNETLFYGLYRRTDSFFENSPMQAEGVAAGEERRVLEEFGDAIPPGVLTDPAHVPNVSSAARQVDRAALREAGALMDAAGWTVGDDGLRRNAAGETLDVEFVHDAPSFERIILPFIANLERLGVDAKNVLIDPAQMEERQENFDFDIAIARLVPGATPSNELRILFGSEAADRPSTFNLAGIKDPAVDGLIERALQAETRDDLEARLKALDRVLRARHIWVPNWTKGEHWLAHWDVFGWPEIKPDYDRGDRTWWFDQAKHDALVAAGALR